jgi:Animal haem peroxidase
MIKHGSMLPLEPEYVEGEASRVSPTSPTSLYFTWSFGYMFPELQNDLENLLVPSCRTVEELRRLGEEGMEDPVHLNDPDLRAPGVPIPTIYTFFGQFVDHDITLERGSMNIKLKECPEPIDPTTLPKNIINSRSPNLDLDNVYGPDLEGRLAPRDAKNPDKLRIDEVDIHATRRGLPPSKDIYNDLPRDNRERALIGDPRDDENVVLAQLHVAFLKAHNALVDRGLRFGEARKLLRQHYQWIVLDDFLERVADSNIVKKIRFHGPKFFDPSSTSLFMPLEFSVAGFRFGHSKVRLSYPNANVFQQSATLGTIFTNAGHRLSADWVIDWTAFLASDDRNHFPRPIDTTLANALLNLNPAQLGPGDPEPNLAVRNLLRGYILRLPTGQAVARAMASQGIRELTPAQILSVAHDLSEDPSKPSRQEELLRQSEFLLTRTPLWFYILAEAAYYSRGYHLGPVGSTIVAEVLIGILRNSSDSILADPHWRPTLGATPGKFELEDLLKLAGVF